MSYTNKWAAANARTSGIATESITNASYTTGSEIDNTTNKDKYASIQLATQFASAPTVNRAINVHILYALDGTNYEDGEIPKKVPVAIFPVRAQTAIQRNTRVNIPIAPFKFKVHVHNDTDQSTTQTAISIYTHNDQISED
jgi:hypothetical protein